MTGFSAAVEIVLRLEGGYVDNSSDRGWATNHGISLRFALGLPEGERLKLDLDGDGDVDADDIRLLKRPMAEDLYHRHFWAPLGCDELPVPVAAHLFDAGVNQGAPSAALLLQASVGAKLDARIGPKTQEAVWRRWNDGPYRLLDEFGARRGLHYARCQDVDAFGLGWFRRLMAVHGVCTRTL